MSINDYDNEFFELIRDSIEHGFLDEETDKAAIGIAMQVAHGTVEEVTPKQRWLWDKSVVPALKKTAAKRDKIRAQAKWNSVRQFPH